MELHNIEQLLEKYNNAETSLQEEAQLRAYFTSDAVAPHLEHNKPLFQYFVNNQKETFTKDVPLKSKRKLYQWISVAAVTVLMLGIMTPQVFGGPNAQEKEQALAAYNQIMEALSLVSLGLNEGKQQLNTLSYVSESFQSGREGASRLNEFNKATNKIFKIK